jgi:hypothetical protein
VNITDERPDTDLTGGALTAVLCGHLERLMGTKKVHVHHFEPVRQTDGKLLLKLVVIGEDGICHDATVKIAAVRAKELRDTLNKLYPVVK